MPNTFDQVRNKYQNSPVVVVLFIVAVSMLLIGLWLFAEDTYSSYLGLQQVQQAFNLNVQIFNGTYWAMSLAPQVASIIFFYLYLSTHEKKYLLWSAIAQGVDFLADTWYRSDGQLLTNPMAAVISMIITFAFFTIGSEFFVTIGAGLVIRLFPPAIREGKKAWADLHSAASGSPGKGSGGGDRPFRSEPLPMSDRRQPSKKEMAEMRRNSDNNHEETQPRIRFE